MCGSCGHVDGISPEHYRSVGLSPSHCYSIVQVASAKDGNVRLLQLRNPWGTGRKWTGSFSDNDKENWTDELKRELSVVDLGNEGIFWMQLEYVRRYFTLSQSALSARVGQKQGERQSSPLEWLTASNPRL